LIGFNEKSILFDISNLINVDDKGKGNNVEDEGNSNESQGFQYSKDDVQRYIVEVKVDY
jgi:hypothetical protein